MTRFSNLTPTNSAAWNWHQLYAGWLALVEQHRLEEQCKRKSPCAVIESAFQQK